LQLRHTFLAVRQPQRALRGPRLRSLFPDTYAAVGENPPGLTLRSHAAYRYVEGRGVLAGYSAAELLDASCGPLDAPAEVAMLRGPQRAHPGLVVHRDRIAPGEITEVGGIQVTTPLRTAYDLARRGGFVERVVAVDALARRHRFAPACSCTSPGDTAEPAETTPSPRS
jgi:hypothetical protein